MKNISLIIFTLLFTSLQAFAQEKVEESNKTEQVEQAPEVENADKAPVKESNLEEKLKNLDPTKIRIYEFNPIKNPEGVVTIIEFNDLSCKKCLQEAQEFYSAINKDDLKNVKLIYKHVNSNDTKLVNQETVYGLIADKVGKFWHYKEEITNNEYKSNEDYISAMMTAGVSKTQLYDNLMLSSESLYKNIDADDQFAQSLEGKSIPMFYIDGYKLGKDLSLEEVKEYISLKVQKSIEDKEKENNKYNMGKF